MGDLRPILGFDATIGALVAVTITDRPRGARGASLVVKTPRPDLDEGVRASPGWHWFDVEGGDVECALAPTDEDVLQQVALDIDQGALADYFLSGDGPLADQLRDAARSRMAIPGPEAPAWAEGLLRRFAARHEPGEDD